MNDNQSTSDSQEHTEDFSVPITRSFRGSFIPKELLDLVGKGLINGRQVMLALLIDSYFNPIGGAWPSKARLAKESGLSIRRIQANIQHLIKVGVIRKTGEHIVRGGKVPVYETFWTQHYTFRQGDANVTRRRNRLPKEVQSLSDSSLLEQPKAAVRESLKNSKGSKTPDDKESPSQKEDSMSFGLEPKDNPPTITAFTDADRLRAKQLCVALGKARKIVTPPKMNRWYKAMHLLNKEVGSERLDKVLNWYCLHVGKIKHLPWAFCGASFREDFVRIEGVMEIEERKNPTIVISEKAANLVQYLNPDNWPGQSAINLPIAVEQTFQFAKDFINRLCVHEGLKMGLSSRLANYVWESIRGHNDFTLTYFRWIYDQIKSITDFRGNAIGFVPSKDNKWFNKYGMLLAKEYSGRTEDWTELIERMYERSDHASGRTKW